MHTPASSADEEDEDATPLSRRQDEHEWNTQRWGDLQDHISEDWSREEFVESGYVAEHRGGTYEGDMHHVTNRRTPSPDADASRRTPSPDARSPAPDRGSYWERTGTSRSNGSMDRWRHRAAT